MWRIAYIWCALGVPILSAQTGAPAAASLAKQYCVGCHSAKARIGGVVLEGIEWTNPGDLMVFFHERCAEIYRALKDGYAGDGHGGGGLAGR